MFHDNTSIAPFHWANSRNIVVHQRKLFKENRLTGKFGRTFQWQGEKGKGFKVFSLIFMLERFQG
jgi:hypothetical protein